MGDKIEAFLEELCSLPRCVGRYLALLRELDERSSKCSEEAQKHRAQYLQTVWQKQSCASASQGSTKQGKRKGLSPRSLAETTQLEEDVDLNATVDAARQFNREAVLLLQEKVAVIGQTLKVIRAETESFRASLSRLAKEAGHEGLFYGLRRKDQDSGKCRIGDTGTSKGSALGVSCDNGTVVQNLGTRTFDMNMGNGLPQPQRRVGDEPVPQDFPTVQPAAEGVSHLTDAGQFGKRSDDSDIGRFPGAINMSPGWKKEQGSTVTSKSGSRNKKLVLKGAPLATKDGDAFKKIKKHSVRAECGGDEWDTMQPHTGIFGGDSPGRFAGQADAQMPKRLQVASEVETRPGFGLTHSSKSKILSSSSSGSTSRTKRNRQQSNSEFWENSGALNTAKVTVGDNDGYGVCRGDQFSMSHPQDSCEQSGHLTAPLHSAGDIGLNIVQQNVEEASNYAIQLEAVMNTGNSLKTPGMWDGSKTHSKIVNSKATMKLGKKAERTGATSKSQKYGSLSSPAVNLGSLRHADGSNASVLGASKTNEEEFNCPGSLPQQQNMYGTNGKLGYESISSTADGKLKDESSVAVSSSNQKSDGHLPNSVMLSKGGKS